MKTQMGSTARKLILGGFAVGTALLLASCGDKTHPRDTKEPAKGSQAVQLADLIRPVYAVAFGVFFFVAGLLVFMMIKYRHHDDDDQPKQVEGSSRMELAWTIIPAVIMLGVGVWSVPTILDISRKPKGELLTTQVLASRIEKNETLIGTKIRVEVTGHRWWWEYRYPDLSGTGKGTGPLVIANELVLPAGVEAQIELKSADVIHSFWLPKISGKVDSIPGRQNLTKLKTDEVGVFYGQCAEFCGISHANMRLTLVTLDDAAFKDWAKRQISIPSKPTGDVTSPAVRGYGLFVSKGCAGCHAISGYAQGNVGPNLTHLYDRSNFAGAVFQLNDENLRKWLRNPQKEKPGSLMVLPQALSEDDITNLMAYLKTLKSCEDPTASLAISGACTKPVPAPVASPA